ncbi:MAG: hypothetical protein Q4F80_08745 [bacterium]|nr:hypothetical protein [bacterium]
MKKLVLLSLCVAALFASCDNFGGGKSQLKAENDSLLLALSERNAELDQIMGTFNDIQEGFRQINEAQSRVDLQSHSSEGASQSQKIKDDLHFITQTMADNKAQIEKLQKQLKNSSYNSAQLKKAIAGLQAELEQKGQQIIALQEELAAKNIRLAELDDAVAGLSTDVQNLSAENEAKAKAMAAQDKALNTAWFVFGTRSELKEQKILQNGDVLKNNDFNKDYFTQIDIRTDKEIKLFSKSAKLLTTHPKGSYILAKDAKGQYILKITNPNEFWSVSRYLVILVKP